MNQAPSADRSSTVVGDSRADGPIRPVTSVVLDPLYDTNYPDTIASKRANPADSICARRPSAVSGGPPEVASEASPESETQPEKFEKSGLSSSAWAVRLRSQLAMALPFGGATLPERHLIWRSRRQARRETASPEAADRRSASIVRA